MTTEGKKFYMYHKTPGGVSQQEFGENWDRIFGKKASTNQNIIEDTNIAAESLKVEQQSIDPSEAFRKRVSDRAYFARLGKEPNHDLDVTAYLNAEKIERDLLTNTEKSAGKAETAKPKSDLQKQWERAKKYGTVVRTGDPFNRAAADAWDNADRLGKVVEKGDLLDRMWKEGQLKKWDETGKEIKPEDKAKAAESHIVKDEEKQVSERKKVETPQPKTADELRQEYEALAKRAQEIAQQLAQMEQAREKAAEKAEAEKSEAERREAENKENQKKLAEEEARKRQQELTNARQEGKNEGYRDGIKEGIEQGEKGLLKELKRPRGIREKIRILFRRHPETEVEKYLRNSYRKKVLTGVGVGLAVLATWAVAQYFGYFLPVPIKELIINAGQIINR